MLNRHEFTIKALLMNDGKSWVRPTVLNSPLDPTRARPPSYSQTPPPLPAPPAPPPRAVPPTDLARANAELKGNPGAAFSADSYPPEALRRGEQGRTVANPSIDASGTPIGCAIEISSGSLSLDQATCRIALRNVRFDPARDGSGAAMPSRYKLPVRWQIPQ